ncbi:uncharacterized protein N7506_005714 [Penicillium brevicompactum]|uniref:uncharacterized protein n=1 Tax=Penicillium brevicompactum TaxID=5074 RepID=UPI002540043A|nr:uncharacterized protein N7506_005714 [Penicillium brevicompactum]KAJ5335778.1 hypothetical protein N7506_005714 [Penicillium brevicompactum]
MRWEPCRQRRSCTQAPPSRQSLEWPLRVLVAAMNRGPCKAESLESLSVDVFQSQHTIHELDMAAEFWTAASEVKDLTLRGQFGFWEPVLAFSPGRGLRSIRLSDCAVWHHNLKSFAKRAIDGVISIRLEKVFIRPYRELGYVTHMGSPIEMVNWLDHVVSSRTNQANIDHPVWWPPGTQINMGQVNIET